MELRVEDVGFTRGGREILSIPSLHVRSGRITAVLGPNGSGKTTLLRLVAGLERPDRGRVLVGGEPADVRRRSIGYVFQEEVFLRQSLLENLTLGVRIRGATRDESREQAMRSLRLLGIEHLASRRADRISGGEGRRASLARALCLRASVLLLDEPMAGLDGATYARLLDDLPGLLSASGATTLLVTHDREEAFRLCDDLVVIAGGRVRAAGSKSDVATNPRERDVAEMLGYTIVSLAGRHVAIPADALALSGADAPIVATVETVLDVVHHWDVSAWVGDARVHVRVPRSTVPPRGGDRVGLEAHVMYPVS